MKVSFGEDLKRQDSGKHKFLHRLAKEFEKQGIRIVSGKSDIFLHIGRNLELGSRAKRKIMRVDGLILNSEQPYKKMNKKILRNISFSDAIVYQGQFCKDAYEKFLKVKKQHAVIYNGADPKEFFPRNPKNFFLASAHWRPHKRLKNICTGYLKALEHGLDADLIVAGDTKKEVRHKRIKYVGWQKSKELNKLLAECIAFIHLAYCDWIPNGICEATVSGAPCIYNNQGGAPEVAEGIGISDKQWDFKHAFKLYDPPKLSDDEIADAMIELKKDGMTIKKRDDLYIKNIAKKYIDFFNSALNV